MTLRDRSGPGRCRTQDKGDNDCVVDLALHRDEVGHDIRRLRRTMQSGTNPATARASVRRPATTSPVTATAYE